VDWNQSKDDLQTTPLDNLRLSNSYFVVVSQKQQEPEFKVELKPGINFVSQVTPGEILDVIESIFGHAQPFTIYGAINPPKPTDAGFALESERYPWELESPVPGILLQADLGLEAAVGRMALNDLFLRIYSPTTVDWLETHPGFEPVLAFSGKL